jgi:hypothetical protein
LPTNFTRHPQNNGSFVNLQHIYVLNKAIMVRQCNNSSSPPPQFVITTVTIIHQISWVNVV